MNMTKKVKADARATLFDVLDKHRVGMLGVLGSNQHMQPMTHHADANAGELWFITSKDTDLARAVGNGARAEYCLATSDGDFFTSLTGTLEQNNDRDKLREVWSIIASTWFEEGRDDPDVALLRMTLQEAAIWTSTNSSIAFSLEIARATMLPESEPDVGEHLVLRLDA